MVGGGWEWFGTSLSLCLSEFLSTRKTRINCIRFAVPADPDLEPPIWTHLGLKIEPQRAPGEVNIDPWRVPGAPWGLLGSCGELLGALAGGLKSSRSRSGGVLGAVLEAFWELLGPSWGLIGSQNGAQWGSKRLGNRAAGAFCYQGAAS